MNVPESSQRAAILLVGQATEGLERELRSRYTLVALPPDPGPQAQVLAREGASIEIAVVTQQRPFEVEWFLSLPALRLIANLGVGHDNIPSREAHERGVAVSNTPGVLDDAVAELAVALVLSTLRRLPGADRFVRDGRWPAEGAYPLTTQLKGRTVGILGLGRIGRAVADRLAPFKCHMAYHSRSRVAGVNIEYADSPRSLAAMSDVLVVAAPASPGAAPLVDRVVLTALGPRGVLVNIARGSVVDQQQMVDMLISGDLGAAGLDVYNDEPYVPRALLGLDNVVLLPHVGSATTETRQAMAQLLLANVAAAVDGRALLTPVLPS